MAYVTRAGEFHALLIINYVVQNGAFHFVTWTIDGLSGFPFLSFVVVSDG